MSARRPSLRNCDECQFADLREDDCRCAHGNKPVFLTPGWEEIRSQEWGWMLRCRDFKRAETGKDDALSALDMAKKQIKEIVTFGFPFLPLTQTETPPPQASSGVTEGTK